MCLQLSNVNEPHGQAMPWGYLLSYVDIRKECEDMKNKFITILSLSILFLFLSNCFAADRYYKILSLDTGTYWLDTYSIKFARNPTNNSIDEDIQDFWQKISHNQDGINETIEILKRNNRSVKGYDQLDYSLVHYLYNTKKNEYTIIATVDYNIYGEVLSSDKANPDWQAIVPESVDEMFLKLVQTYSIVHKREIREKS